MSGTPSNSRVSLPSAEYITLGDRDFLVQPMPWGVLRKLNAAIRRIGVGVAAGAPEDALLDDMTEVITTGLGITVDELDAMPGISFEQTGEAFRALMRVSGMEREMERTLGEARRRVQQMSLAPTPGTPSMPSSLPTPAGAGASSTPT